MATALSTSLSDLPTVQVAWHWLSWGQTRPQMAGSRLTALMIPTDLRKSPSSTALMKPGMSISTGQPLTQGAFLHWRQRAASTTACSRL